MATLLSEWCNIFGGETGGAVMLGGLSKQRPDRQWYCPTRAVARFRMVCEHGHSGQIMPLCKKHWNEFKDKVTFCPRCNNEPPGHKCQLRLDQIS